MKTNNKQMKRQIAWLLPAALFCAALTACRVSAEDAYAMPTGAGLGACVWAAGDPAPALRIYLRNGKVQVGHGNFNAYAPIVLGEARLPAATDIVWELTRADRTGRAYRVRGEDGEGGEAFFDVVVSRLTPAILIDLSNTADCALFAGDKSSRWTRWQKGMGQPFQFAPRNEFVLVPPHPGIKDPVKLGAPRVPGRYAWSDGKSVRQGMLSGEPVELPGVENGWMLVWYGPDAWFTTGESTMEMLPALGRDYRPEAGDAPMLLVFSDVPEIHLTGAPAAGGGVDATGPDSAMIVSFEAVGAKMAVLPLYGYQIPRAGETAAWSASLPASVIERCDQWAGRLSEYPLALEETLDYDESTDTAIMTGVFTYKRVREGGARCAPLPPMLELARQAGFPIELSGVPSSPGIATYCGPYTVIPGSDSYAARVSGMGRYVWEVPVPRLPPAEDGPQAAAARAELCAEVDKALAAGHLAPFNLPFKQAWGWASFYGSVTRLLYSAPGQTLGSLAATIPFLDPERRRLVRDYLVSERAGFPPETIARMSPETGARREVSALPADFIRDHLDNAKARGNNFHVKHGLVPAQVLYDMASFYAASETGLIKEDGFVLEDALRVTVRPWLLRREWATLGWYSWKLDERDGNYFASYGWNTTADINRQVAALIGWARLSRLAGSPAAEKQAMAGLASALIHRFAVGKYAGWLYSQGGFLFPPPAGFTPADDPRVVALSEEEAVFEYGINQSGLLPFFSDEEGPYMALTPETARFFADHLGPEAKGFALMTAAFYPDAHLTLGTPRRIAEWWHNYPQDARQIFLVHAWILGEPADKLQPLLDVPIVPVGDWYHIDKLVALLQAYCGVDWKPFMEGK